MTASEAREDAKALRTLASGTRAVADANWSPRTEMFTGATARADRLDRAAVALDAYADGIDAPEFRPTSSDTTRLHRIRARLLDLVPLDGTMSMADDVQRLDRALADAEARGRQHGLLAAAWLAEDSYADAESNYCDAIGHPRGSSYWEGVMDEDESLLGDLAVLAKEATDGR